MNGIFNQYKINTQIDVPIYRQLSDMLESAIKKGELPYGEKLPTIQEMIDTLDIARGTVKRAYDELELKGLIEKAQGRGTFVSFKPADTGSRKEQALMAIEKLFSELEEMGFSAAEINIFINLKLRDWVDKEPLVKLALIDCNNETLYQISDELRRFPNVDPYAYTLDSIKQYPYKLGDNFDLIITTHTHREYLDTILTPDQRTVEVALRPSARFLSSIIRLSRGKRVGIVVYSDRFGSLIHSACKTYTEDVTVVSPLVTSLADSGIEEYLSALDVVIVPKYYEKFFSASASSAIRNFGGDLIEAFYELDEGSKLYLERKITKLFDAKSI